MTTKNQPSFQESTLNELDFRIWFKSEFGMDYQEAIKWHEDKKAESQRRWKQTLTKHRII